MNEVATGIIWVGPIFDRGGYGNVSRNYLRGLKRIGFPVKVVNYGPHHDHDLDPDIFSEIASLLVTDAGPHPVGIIHRTPDMFPKVKFKNVVRRIGCTIFETDRIPDHWVKCCNRMDEIWVPSRFNFETFSRSGVNPDKLRIVPIPVDSDFFKPCRGKLLIEGQKRFTFLYTFAFNWRKGFDLLLEAYFKEFRSADDVSLILKVYEDQGIKQDLIKNVIMGSIADRVGINGKDAPHVVIIDKALNQDELRRLYNSCDLYISTDRANGWGMPCMEVMAMGKPAATIDWSGSTEFMKKHNSLLIRPTGRLVSVDQRLVQAQPLLYKGHQWAEVSVDEVRKVMRFACENPDALRTMAEREMKDIRENFSIESIARKLVQIITSFEVDHKRSICRKSVQVSIQPRWLRVAKAIRMSKLGSLMTLLKSIWRQRNRFR